MPDQLSHTGQGDWLILVYALIGDGTYNAGIVGQCSNQLSHLARASIHSSTV